MTTMFALTVEEVQQRMVLKKEVPWAEMHTTYQSLPCFCGLGFGVILLLVAKLPKYADV